jgi:hypothetical protein
MGGFGSGRSGYRIIVENCLRLDINFMQRECLLDRFYGTLSWTHLIPDGTVRTIGYSVDYDKSKLTLSYLTYLTSCPEKKYHIEEGFRLTTTRTNFNGRRYWFECPQCLRRCGKLYRPPSELYFRCRLCYNLTYDSCNGGRKSIFKFLVKEEERIMKNEMFKSLKVL